MTNFKLRNFYNDCLAALPWVLLAGLFQFSFQKFLPGQRLFKGQYGFDYFTLIDIYVAGVAIMFLVLYLRSRKHAKGLKDAGVSTDGRHFLEPRRIPKEFSWAVLLILVAGLLQIFFQEAYQPILNSPFEYLRAYFIYPFLLFYIIFKTADHGIINRIVKNYLIVTTVFCVLALVQYLFGVFPGEQYDFTHRLVWPYIDFLTLKSASANWVAFFVTPALILSFIKIVSGFKAAFKDPLDSGKKFLSELTLYNACFILSMIVVYLTQSYGAYAAIFIAILFYFFRTMKFKKFIPILVLMLALAGGIYFLQKSTYKYKILTGSVAYKYDNSVASRGDIWRMNLAFVKQHPILGVGLNEYQSWFSLNAEKVLGHAYKEVQPPPHPHNFFMGFYANLGILGFVAMLILVIGIFWRYKFDPENPALFILLAIMIHGLIDAYYWKQEIAYIFWMVILMAYLYREKSAVTK